MVKFSAADIRTLIIAALVLGIMFGYDDGQEIFQLSYWITNLVIMVVIAFISLLLFDVGHKIRAKRSGCESSINIWSARRFSYAASAHGPAVPLGIIIPLVFSVLTQGALKVATLTTTSIKTVIARRLGKQFKRTTEFEEGQIALAGPLTALIVACIAKVLAPSLPVMQYVMAINLHLGLFNMLPLPTLDGGKVYFGSPLMFAFFFVVMLIAFFFLNILSVFSTILFALITACGVLLVYYNKAIQ